MEKVYVESAIAFFLLSLYYVHMDESKAEYYAKISCNIIDELLTLYEVSSNAVKYCVLRVHGAVFVFFCLF